MVTKPVINSFLKGVNTDISEENMPNDTLSNAHNIRITDNDGKHGIAQKAELLAENLLGYNHADLIPLAAKEYNDIVYFISYNTTQSTIQEKDVIEYGTYPAAPDQDLSNPNYDNLDVIYEYRPLPNFYEGTYGTYLGPFQTTEFGYTDKSEIDIEIQPSYDGSVNIISTCEGVVPRIVNSRLSFNELKVTIVRRNNNEDNIYSDFTIDKTLLIPILTNSFPSLIFKGILNGAGTLKTGGYKYYFKLKTADGIESPIIEESRLVSIHSGSEFGKAESYIIDKNSTNAVQFTLEGLTTNVYKYVSVYYTYNTGQTEEISTSAYKINYNYLINDDGICDVTHTGYEIAEPVDISEITAEYSPITSAKAITQKNNRLLLSNVNTYKLEDSRLKDATLTCYIEEAPADLITIQQKIQNGTSDEDISYADPNNIYHYVSYIPGETYEFAINFVYKSGSVSPAYPILGYDFVDALPSPYDPTTIPTDTWDYSKNKLGIVRMPDISLIDQLEVVDVGSITASTSVIDLPSDAASTSVTVTSTDTWDVSWEFIEGETNWDTLSVTQTDSTTLSISTEENTSTDPRYANIKIYLVSNTDVYYIIQVGQDGTSIEAAPEEQEQTSYPISIPSKLTVKTMVINTEALISNYQDLFTELDIVGYYISRKERIPDLMQEGLLTLAATAPIQSMPIFEDMYFTFGMYAGYGFDDNLGDNVVLFPLPGNAMPFSTEGLADYNYDTTNENVHQYFDSILYAPLASADKNKYFAFYSPDITSDTAAASILDTKAKHSIYLDNIVKQSINYNIINVFKAVYSDETRYGYSADTSGLLSITEKNININDISYVDDGVRGFTGLKFCSKLDRQAVMLLYTELNVNAVGSGISRTNQYTLHSNELVNNQLYNYYKAYADLNKDISNYIDNPYVITMLPGVKYSPYIGIKVGDSDGIDITSLINLPDTGSEQGYFTAYNTISTMLPKTNETVLGSIVRIYNNEYGRPLPMTQWISRYDNDRSSGYFAISKRFPITHALSSTTNSNDAKLIGGDCYTGFYYQRVWRPSGIDGVPTATNPFDYYDSTDGVITREGVNITSSGYAIGFPVRSKYNFAIRSYYEADEVENTLYGGGRTYTPSDIKDKIHGNRQAETSVINYGNFKDYSVLKKYKFTDDIPFSNIEYKNRILVSDISITGEFENGFRNFKGLNFKDYDEDLGEIVATTSSGLFTYIVYTSGVAMIEVSERTAITSKDTGANVYLSASEVLPPKSTPILTSIGSQHMKSVVNTESAILGVDANTKKIWMVNKTDVNIISDARMQYTLNRLITTNLIDIYSSYDQATYEVTFTFKYDDNSYKSIIYNLKYDIWYGTSDINKLYQFNIAGDRLSINDKGTGYKMYYPLTYDFDDISEELQEHSLANVDQSTLDSVIVYDSFIEFVVKLESKETFSTPSIIINGSGIPKSIEIMSESIPSYTIDKAADSVFSIDTNTLPLHTNIYMLDADYNNLSLTTNRIIRTDPDGVFKDIKVNDNITLELKNASAESEFYQFTVAAVSVSGDTTAITVDRDINTAFSPLALYYGWKIPQRLSFGEAYGDRVKITIPSKKTADLISGNYSNQQKYYSNQSSALPYGKWIKMRVYFSGLNPVNIDSIITNMLARYS